MSDFATSGARLPAVDLAAGASLYTFEFAKRFKRLEWYATDQDAAFRQTQGALDILLKHHAAELLFSDADGVPVRADDEVTLSGLSNAEYNGLTGTVLRAAEKEGRFAVKVSGRPKEMSFKGVNLKRKDATVPYSTIQTDPEECARGKAVLPGLIERACVVDIDVQATWSSLEPVMGSCAVVVCTLSLIHI